MNLTDITSRAYRKFFASWNDDVALKYFFSSKIVNFLLLPARFVKLPSILKSRGKKWETNEDVPVIVWDVQYFLSYLNLINSLELIPAKINNSLNVCPRQQTLELKHKRLKWPFDIFDNNACLMVVFFGFYLFSKHSLEHNNAILTRILLGKPAF